MEFFKNLGFEEIVEFEKDREKFSVLMMDLGSKSSLELDFKTKTNNFEQEMRVERGEFGNEREVYCKNEREKKKGEE